MKIPTVLAGGVEQALNRYLRLDPEAAAALGPAADKLIGLELCGLSIRLYLSIAADHVHVEAEPAREPDAWIRGTPLALARSKFRQQGMLDDVEITGDTEAAQALYKALAAVEIDWEELLAKRIGDAPAFQLGELARRFRRWSRRSRDSLRQDVTDYLQEEAHVLPTRYEIEDFVAEVDTLRDDVERLAARLDRLERRHGRDESGAC